MRRRWLVRLGIALTILTVLAAGVTWYLNTVFLPGPARQWIGAWLAEQTGRRVQLGALTFRFWEGISIDQVILFEDRRYGEQPFLEVDRVTFSVLYLPFLKARRLILPSVRLIRPRIHLIRDASGAWNAASLRGLQPVARPARATPAGALLTKLVIVDGSLLLDDQHQDPGLNAALTRLDLRVALQLPHAITVKGTAQWHTTPVTPLLLHGRWDLTTRTGQVALTARQCPLETLRPYLPRTETFAVSELAGTVTMTVKTQLRPSQTRLTATVTTTGCRWAWEGLRGAGDLTIVGHTAFRPGTRWTPDAVTASVSLHGVTVQLPARHLLVEQLTGTVRVSSQGLEAPALTAQLNGLPVRGRVTLTPLDSASGWRQPTLDATVASDGPLAALWQATAPYRTGWLASVALDGAGALEAVVQGPLARPHVSTTLRLDDGRFEGPGIGVLQQLHGRVRIEPNLVTATDITGVWRDTPISLDGTLVNFAAPEINAAARWGEVTAEASLAVNGPRVTVTNLVTTYRRSRAQTTGELTRDPSLEGTLYSEVALDLADALTLLPASATTGIRRLDPTGVLKGRVFFRGPLATPTAWELGVKAHATTLMVASLRFDNVQGEYRQREGQAMVPTLSALWYGGLVSASGTMPLDQPRRPFTANVSVANVELGRLAADTPWRQQQLAGLLNGEWQFRGSAEALPSTLEGQGRLQVTNGRLFEMPLLKGMADLLGAPALRHVTFREAAGTFTLRGDVLRTDDLTFYSDLATLTTTGTVGPAGALDARIVASIDPTAFEQSPDVAKKAGQFLHQAGYLIGEIKVTGTLDHPQHEIVPVTLNRILKEQVFERLRGLVQGIFQ